MGKKVSARFGAVCLFVCLGRWGFGDLGGLKGRRRGD